MIKNQAGQKIGAQLVSATDGSAFTGSVTVAVTVDAGTQATGSVGSGACAHEGLGYHSYAPAQAETNGDLIAFTFTGTGAVPVTVQVYTVAGDAFTRLGAPAGASVSADIAAVKVETAAILTDTGTTLDGKLDTIDNNVDSILADTGTDGVVVASIANNAITANAIASNAITSAKIATDAIGAAQIAADAIGASELAASAVSEIQSGLATSSALSSLDTKIGTPAGDSVSADIADVEGKVDDLETRLGTPSNLGSGATVAANLADIEAQTDDIGAAGAGLTAIPWNSNWDAEVESEVADALEATIADSIPSDGTRPSVKQALYMLTQFMLERSVSSTTVTVRKVDGSTSLFTLSLNDATSPTSISRAS